MYTIIDEITLIIRQEARRRSSCYPCAAPEMQEPPVCSENKNCKGCPYPAHGFVCWRDGESCMRTDMRKIMERSNKRESSIE